VVQYVALGTVDRGVAVIARTGFDARGVTVWRRPSSGSTTRLVRDWQYLVQQEDGEVVVWMPAVQLGDRITIAGPGHEPTP
jgi:hypothetical protein